MRHRDRWVVLSLVLLSLLVPACRDATTSSGESYEPARLIPLEGSDIGQVVLTKEAAQRIDLQTASVEAAAAGTRVVIPYAALFYGVSGETWVYTQTEPLTFVRESVAVDEVDGTVAYLSSGPPPGRAVVTVGAAELFGVENELGS